MLTFIIILLSVIAFFALLLSINVRLILEYQGEPALFLKILFVKIRLFSDKKKKRRRSMSKRKAQRIKDGIKKKKEEKKQRKEEQKKENKGSAKGIISTVNLVASTVKRLLSLFTKHLKIKVARIRIKIATGDAATTAIEYGAVTQSINVLLPLLEEIDNFSVSRNADIRVNADFTAQESEADIRVSLSLRACHILKIAFSTLFNLIKHQFNDLKGKE